jgi:hypothetical protein
MIFAKGPLSSRGYYLPQNIKTNNHEGIINEMNATNMITAAPTIIHVKVPIVGLGLSLLGISFLFGLGIGKVVNMAHPQPKIGRGILRV